MSFIAILLKSSVPEIYQNNLSLTLKKDVWHIPHFQEKVTADHYVFMNKDLNCLPHAIFSDWLFRRLQTQTFNIRWANLGYLQVSLALT